MVATQGWAISVGIPSARVDPKVEPHVDRIDCPHLTPFAPRPDSLPISLFASIQRKRPVPCLVDSASVGSRHRSQTCCTRHRMRATPCSFHCQGARSCHWCAIEARQSGRQLTIPAPKSRRTPVPHPWKPRSHQRSVSSQASSPRTGRSRAPAHARGPASRAESTGGHHACDS